MATFCVSIFKKRIVNNYIFCKIKDFFKFLDKNSFFFNISICFIKCRANLASRVPKSESTRNFTQDTPNESSVVALVFIFPFVGNI